MASLLDEGDTRDVMIFSDDLKHLIYLADNIEDVDAVERTVKMFHKQNQVWSHLDWDFTSICLKLLHLSYPITLGFLMENVEILCSLFFIGQNMDPFISVNYWHDMLDEL